MGASFHLGLDIQDSPGNGRCRAGAEKVPQKRLGFYQYALAPALSTPHFKEERNRGAISKIVVKFRGQPPGDVIVSTIESPAFIVAQLEDFPVLYGFTEFPQALRQIENIARVRQVIHSFESPKIFFEECRLPPASRA
jgi:hypothetical protein